MADEDIERRLAALEQRLEQLEDLGQRVTRLDADMSQLRCFLATLGEAARSAESARC